MASKKLEWKRTPLMQHQYESKRSACWAAVIEAALAFYNKATAYTPVTVIEKKFEDEGGKIGEGGIKNFPAALRVFDLYDKHENSKTKFGGKYKQIFNFMKWQIDKGNPVLLGFRVPSEDARHAGMVFGYNEPDEVFFIEPGSIAMLGAGNTIVADEKMAFKYTDNAIKLEKLFTAQVIGSAAQQAAGKGLTMEASAIYRIKAPAAAGQPPAGEAALVPFVINTAAAPAN